jgi:hypothetical protein
MVDWQVIEAGYRAGECSVRELARREGITEGAIRKRAKAKGWPARGTRFAGANENRAISEAGTHPGTRFRDQYARVRAREGGTHSNPVEINGPEWAGTPHGIPESRGPEPEPTPDEARNGWTAATLAAYRRERDLAANRVGGNVVTPWTRPKRRPVIENAGMKVFNPHRWGKGRL